MTPFFRVILPEDNNYLIKLINSTLSHQITGIVLISVGATVQGVFHNYADFLSTQFFSVPSFLIAIGIIIFIIAFFGCCGAVRENYCMILTFAVLMVIVFILELAAGISGYVLRNDTESLIRTGLQDSMKSYIAQEKQTTYLWDHIQRGVSVFKR